jgi:hypothetical protein
MKPTPQISRSQRHSRGENSPLTDYAYQLPAEAVDRSSVAEKAISERRTFRKVSNEFFRAEATREYVTEAIFFLGISCVAAWPVTVAIHQLTCSLIWVKMGN